MADRQQEVEVYDTQLDLGGSFTVSIIEEIDETTVKVRVWYGRATMKGWETWREWDSSMFTTPRDRVTKKRICRFFRTARRSDLERRAGTGPSREAGSSDQQ
jgi:hypothetical protein